MVICFFDGSDEAVYRVGGVTRNTIDLELIETGPCDRNPRKPVTLIQAIGKSGKADDVVKSATAIGATAIRFVSTSRTIGRLAGSRVDRLDSIALEACRQCGRTALPSVEFVPKGAEWWSDANMPAVRLFADEEGGVPLTSCLDSDTYGCAIAVGPEGGWADDEREALSAAGWRAVSLGPRILRTELAASVALGTICALLES